MTRVRQKTHTKAHAAVPTSGEKKQDYNEIQHLVGVHQIFTYSLFVTRVVGFSKRGYSYDKSFTYSQAFNNKRL